MLTPDFSNQPYIAEVIRTSAAPADILSSIERLLSAKWKEDTASVDGVEIQIYHGFVMSSLPYHRATRTVIQSDGSEVRIPRSKTIKGHDHFFYDVFVVNRGKHFIVAAPFHGVARDYFPKIDKALVGKRIVYETLNITNMVVRLGLEGQLVLSETKGETSIVVTRCHLNYDDPGARRRDLEQVRLTGANLGATEIYADLIRPVLQSRRSALAVTPVLLGFALLADGIKKSGAATDRHGNFKVTVGPGLRQLTRLFMLLDGIEEMQSVVSTTSNVPILQSDSIEAAE